MDPEKFYGVIPPMVTPLAEDGGLDVEGVSRLVEHILAGGVHGLFLLGTTGEATDLPYAVRRELVQRVCGQVDGRVPVLVGITDTVIDESLRLAEYAADCGANALVAAPPYYFAAGQPELVDYYLNLADRLPLSLFLYNMPAQVKVSIDVQTVVELAKHPNIIGLKDSSGNIGYFNACRYAVRDRPDFRIFIGPEEAMGEVVLMGAAGGVAGGANLFPRTFVDLYDAATAKDVDKVRSLQERIMHVSSLIYGVGHHNSSFVKGVKCALSLMGICSGTLAAPREPFNASDRAIVRERLVELGVEL
ncbi:MAG: dihydrodipicolinate synthase family protein [Lentisphaerae bacterium]|nr:dihydrodipicolinate synthase family protein [Lentisphaerota bacterium]